MLKSGICILLVFHEKMIVLYKLNFFFTKKLHRERTEGNKNTKAVLFMKERRNFYSVSIRECSFPIFNRGRKIVLIWFEIPLTITNISNQSSKDHIFLCISGAQGMIPWKSTWFLSGCTLDLKNGGSLSLCGLHHKPGEMFNCISSEFSFVIHTIWKPIGPELAFLHGCPTSKP